MIDTAAMRLAVRVAEAPARRDPASLVLRAMLAVGRGVLAATGGTTDVRGVPIAGVVASVMHLGRPTCTLQDKVICFGERYCPKGDVMGCNVAGMHEIPGVGSVPGIPGADQPACISCNRQPGTRNPCVGSTPNVDKWWSCCCNGHLTVCVDCISPYPPVGPISRRRCICEYFAGPCR